MKQPLIEAELTNEEKKKRTHTASFKLQQRENYDLPKGFGPQMIVLALFWLSARRVFAACLTTVREACHLTHSDVKVMLIFGGGNDPKMKVSLENGCGILVATPHCFLRMLQNEFTNLNRVCHLVLEDADILTDKFTKQVKEIMELYQTTFKRQVSSKIATDISQK